MNTFAAYDDGVGNMVLIAFKRGLPIIGIVTPKDPSSTLRNDLARLKTASGIEYCDVLPKEGCERFAATHGAVGYVDEDGRVEVFNEDYEGYLGG